MKKITDFLRDEGISPELIQEVQEFSATHPVKEGLKGRIPVPHFYYYGKKCGRKLWQHFCVERIYCLQVKKPREKMYLQKIWLQFSAILHGTSHFM